MICSPWLILLVKSHLQSVVKGNSVGGPQVGVGLMPGYWVRRAVFPSENENSPSCVCTSSAGQLDASRPTSR